MNWGSRSILGLALSDRTIQCAQITSAKGRAVVERLALYELPAGVTYEQPEALGQALKSFLHAQRFSASRTVVGVPLRWIVTHTADLPPADGATARAMLRMQAERLSSGDEMNMVYDCVGEPGAAGSASQAILVGLMRRQLERVEKLAEAAGLPLAGVTPSSLVVSRAVDALGEQTMLLLAEHGTELVVNRSGTMSSLRHLRAMSARSGDESAVWDGELRRACTLAGHPSSGAGRLVLVDAVGMTAADHARVGQVLGDGGCNAAKAKDLSVDVRAEALNGAAGKLNADTFIAAVALAMAGQQRSSLAVNFIKSRLAAPAVRRFGRSQVLAIAAGVVIVAGLMALYFTMQHRESDAARLQANVKGQEPVYQEAMAEIARFNYGRRYFEMRTPVLDCLKQITLTFRDGEPIWITTFTMKETGKGMMQGKSTDQRVILAVLDRLRSHAEFSDVQLQDMRESSGREREIVFSIKLTYLGGRGGS